MSGEGDLQLDTAGKRKTLWIVLWLNVAIAIGFFAVGYLADSNAMLGSVQSEAVGHVGAEHENNNGT